MQQRQMQADPPCAWPRAGLQAGASCAASGRAAGGKAPGAAGRGAKRPSSAPESPTHAARAKALMAGRPRAGGAGAVRRCTPTKYCHAAGIPFVKPSYAASACMHALCWGHEAGSLPQHAPTACLH